MLPREEDATGRGVPARNSDHATLSVRGEAEKPQYPSRVGRGFAEEGLTITPPVVQEGDGVSGQSGRITKVLEVGIAEVMASSDVAKRMKRHRINCFWRIFKRDCMSVKKYLKE